MTILIIILLLLANAFFVAAEFALVRVRGFKLNTMANDGLFGARLARRIHQQMEPYLAACQLGITMASLGLGWVGEPFVASIVTPWFQVLALSEQAIHLISFLIGFIVFSSLHIVLGEQVPKTWAIRVADRMVRWCAFPLHAFYLMVFPLNWTLNKASGSILALFGVEGLGHAEVLSGQEIKGLIETSSEHGEITQSKAEMLSNLFAFDQRSVARVMIPRADVTAFDATAGSDVHIEMLRQNNHSRFPVIDSSTNTPIGIILIKDLYQAVVETGKIPWESLESMYRKPLVVAESLRVPDLFETMRQQREHMALVVDEYGQFIGLVTLEDLLEEIVGDINDETDELADRYPIVATGDGWKIHGLASLADVERNVGLAVDDTLNANTLSGLLMHRLSRMPVVGDIHQEGDFEIEVTAVEDHHVTEVKLFPVLDVEDEPTASPDQSDQEEPKAQS